MNYSAFGAIFLFLSFIVDARLYSLNELINSAIQHSSELKLAKKQIEYTDLQIQEIYSHSFPSILSSLNIYHSFTSSPYYALYSDITNTPGILDGSFHVISDETTSLIQFQNMSQMRVEGYGPLSKNTIVSSVDILQPVFFQGKNYLQLKIARSTQAMAVCTFEEIKHHTIAETTKKYYTVLIKQEQCLLQKEVLGLMQERLRLSRVDFSFAHATEIDTLESLLLLEQATLDATRTESERDKAAEALIVQAAIIESPSTFHIDDQLPEPVFYITVEEAVTDLYEKNNQIKKFKGAERIHDIKINLAKSKYLPIVYLGGTVGKIGFTSDITFPLTVQWETDQKIFAGITWNLFSGFKTQRIIQQQINQKNQFLLSQEQTIHQLELKTRIQYTDIIVMKERLNILKRMIMLSERKFIASKNACEKGYGTLFTQKKAELEMKTSKFNYNEQLYEFHMAVIDFKEMIGLIQGY